MIRIKMLAWFMLTLGINGCKTHQPDNLPPTQLRFGSGGGFTGALTEYVLLENGQVFVRKNLEDDYQLLGKVKKSKAKALFKSWENQPFLKEEFQHPGNIYYFVSMTKEDKNHRLSWGHHNHPASDELKFFYKECNTLVKKMKPAAAKDKTNR